MFVGFFLVFLKTAPKYVFFGQKRLTGLRLRGLRLRGLRSIRRIKQTHVQMFFFVLTVDF